MTKKKSEKVNEVDEMYDLIMDAVENPIVEKLKEEEAANQAALPKSLVLQEAYNIVWSDSESQYKMVTVGYDIATNYAKILKVEDMGPSSALATYKLETKVRLKAFKKEDKV